MRGERSRREREQGAERGATVVEYSLLVGLIAIVLIAAASLMSSSLSGMFLAAGEPFSGTQTSAPKAVAQVKAGKSVTLDVAQLRGIKGLNLNAIVDRASGEVEAKSNGTIKFEADDRATGTARITYTYSYKQGSQTVRGEGSMLVDIVR